MGSSSGTIKIGYRIFSVKEGGSMSNIPIRPLLDFIVFEDDMYSLEEAVTSESPIELPIYNIVTRSIRKVTVELQTEEGKASLGITARPEDYTNAHVRIIRVLSYMQGSPLEQAGFSPITDYILGTAEETFNNLDDFETFIKRNEGKSINMFVYNSDTDEVRNVDITPSSAWGGGGYLGGDFGFGSFHEIPQKVIANEEANFDVDSNGKEEEDKALLEDNDTVVPLNQNPDTY